MGPNRRMRPGVEPLESRLSLSAGSLVLGGQGSGTYVSSRPVPGARTTETLQGMGTVAPLGDVSVAGSLDGARSAGHARTGDSFTLTATNGSVTIQLRGVVPRPGLPPRPSAGTFTITGGTGAYATATGSGTATLTETPERHPTPHPGEPTPEFIVAPMFTLNLGPPRSTARDATGP